MGCKKIQIGNYFCLNTKGLLAKKTCTINHKGTKAQSFSTTYSYDNLKRVSSITSPAGKFGYTYNKQGRIASLTMNGSTVSHEYDKVGRLVAKNLTAGGNETQLAVYTYDKLNRRTASKIFDTAWKYKYDNKNQLIGAVAQSAEGKQLFKYGFDQIGNRLTATTNKNEILLAYNNVNQITSATPAKVDVLSKLAGDYQYDNFGNLISTPKANYRYNLNNRLVEVNQKDSKLTFAYDGNGRRIFKKVFDKSGALIAHTKFLYSGFKCVAEINALSNKVLKFNEWNGEELLGVYNPQKEQALSCLIDGNKNVIGLMGSNGEISAKFAYSPFGKSLARTGKSKDDCSFGFSSEYLDKETNLVYYNYRYYSAEHGRWLKRDSIAENGGYNLYAMVGNNSINKIDIKGFGPWTCSPGTTQIKQQQKFEAGVFTGAADLQHATISIPNGNTTTFQCKCEVLSERKIKTETQYCSKQCVYLGAQLTWAWNTFWITTSTTITSQGEVHSWLNTGTAKTFIDLSDDDLIDRGIQQNNLCQNTCSTLANNGSVADATDWEDI